MLPQAKEFMDNNTPKFSLNQATDYDIVSPHLFVKLRSAKYLQNQDVPFLPIGDIGACVCIDYLSANNDKVCIMMTNSLMKNYNRSFESIYTDALNNTGNIARPVVHKLTELISAKSDSDDILCVYDDAELAGSAVILLDNVAKDIFNRIGSYYIIPSSVHELLLYPALKYDPVFLLKSVHDMTTSRQIDFDDYLSSSIFYYDIRTEKIMPFDVTTYARL